MAQPEHLAGFENTFGDFFAINKSAIGRIEVPDQDVSAAQYDLAMMTRNRGFRDLEAIVLDPADGGGIHLQLMSASRHARAEDNKFGHN